MGTAANASGNGTFNTAVGAGSTATGANSSAFGSGASATYANATAIGSGAVATRANQQSFGTTSNTYTMAGITSAASRAAQTGPLQFVTTDSGGNLGSSTLGDLGIAGIADIAGINGQIAGLNSRLNDLDGQSSKALNGVAMAFAMSGTPWVMPAERFAMTLNWGTFDGTNALALSGAMRLGEHMQANGGVAYGTNGGGVGGRLGVRIGW